MKISREARNQARKFFQICAPNGKLDAERTKAVFQSIAEEKPRGYFPILYRLRKLIELAVEKETITVDTAVELKDQGASIFEALEAKFGPAQAKVYEIDSTLIGGMRIQRGSDVWDGSVRSRLDNLKRSLHHAR